VVLAFQKENDPGPNDNCNCLDWALWFRKRISF
jgi:hypothetical protein